MAAASPFTIRVDRSQELKLLADFDQGSIDKIMEQAAKVGAEAAAKVLKSDAPIGTSQRLSQYYRAQQLRHGTFQKSVRAAAIRSRQSGIVGYKAGPIGKHAFTRHWIELGTRYSRGNPWVQRNASAALSAAYSASDAVLTLYARDAG